MSDFHKKVSKLIQDIKAPKGQMNKFGNYKYRSCEDILESVKPHLNDLVLTVSDDIHFVEGRFYVKAIATIVDGNGNSVQATAFARETLSKKGMDEAQVTGSASSYARKYALNGLLCIDDSKDADTQDNSQKQPRNYQAEKKLKDEILKICAEKCDGMSPPNKMQWFKVNTGLDSAIVLNECEQEKLNEILAMVKKA